MKNLAIIPARGGSKGIPRKNIRQLAGKPLIAHTIEHAGHARMLGRIIVSTDDPEIAAVSKQYGAEVIWRPSELSGDNASSESALLHALEYLQQSENYVPDFIVFLQCTSPLRLPNDIDNAIQKFLKENADSLLSVSETRKFIWKNINDRMTSISYDFKNRKRRQDLEKIYFENGSIYIFKPHILTSYNNRLEGKISFHIMKDWQHIDIDDEFDFNLAEVLFAKYLLNKEKLNIKNIKLFIYDFDGVLTDNKVLMDQFGKESVWVHRSDGLAISKIKKVGIRQIVLSTEQNPIVQKRAKKLGIECSSGIKNKKDFLESYLKSKRIKAEEVIYVGNDINDYEAMKFIACPIAPSDACEEVRKIAKYVTKSKGGEGVIRELLGLFLERE